MCVCFCCVAVLIIVIYLLFFDADDNILKNFVRKIKNTPVYQNGANYIKDFRKPEPFQSGGTNIQMNSNEASFDDTTFPTNYPELIPSYYPYIDEQTLLEQQLYNPQNFETDPYNINQYEVTQDYIQYQN